MSVEIQVRVRSATIHLSRIRRLVQRVLAELGESSADVGILFVGDGQMRRLNREYRRKDRTTDVLAFAQRDATVPRIRNARPKPLGDVVISLPKAMAQAREDQRSLDEEIIALLVHGMLHLCGYDHERSEMEARRMLRREKMVRRKLGSAPRLVRARSIRK
ncbi:rRNA maturation RNase YbeY [Petrachloros mirabilis]